MRTLNVWTSADWKAHAWRQGSLALRAIGANTKLDILLAFLLPDQPDQSHQQTLSSLFLSHHHSSTQKHVCACVFVWTLVAYISIQYVFARQSCLQDLGSVCVRAAHTHIHTLHVTFGVQHSPPFTVTEAVRFWCSAPTPHDQATIQAELVQWDQKIRRQPLGGNKCNDKYHMSGFLDAIIVFNWIKKQSTAKKRQLKK